jgi:hypothetical protein
MASATLALETNKTEDSLAFDIAERSLYKGPIPPPKDDFSNDSTKDVLKFGRSTQLTQALRHRLDVSGPNQASIEVPLQVDDGKSPNFWLQTPSSLEGFQLRLFIDNDTKEANLRINIEYTGLPVEEALSYVRFLHALHSKKGEFSLTVLESRKTKIPVGELPLFIDNITKATLEATKSFLENLVVVKEATGTNLVYPEHLDAEDVRNARRVAEIVRTGWDTEYIEDLTLTPTVEGLSNLPLADRGAAVKIAVESKRTSVRLLDQEIDLGPSIHWIEQARMQTSLSHVRKRLESESNLGNTIDILFEPVDNSPLHTFFYDWPKPSLNHIERQLDAFEKKYGMSSEVFAPAWRKDKRSVQHIDHGNIWLSLIGARKQLKRAQRG